MTAPQDPLERIAAARFKAENGIVDGRTVNAYHSGDVVFVTETEPAELPPGCRITRQDTYSVKSVEEWRPKGGW